MATFLQRLRATLRNFRGESRGNVIITFAICIVPIIGTVGAAVDFSRVSALKAAMQAAVDSTALGMSKLAASTYGTGGTGGQASLDSAAASYFNAIFKHGGISTPTVSTVYSTAAGTTLTVTSTTTMPTSFLAMLSWAGMPTSFTISATSTVTWGNSRLRVALVLDNTGSMAASGKLTALQTATKSLLGQLQAAATTNGDVYVSIIPFVNDVSVDPTTNYTASWIDWTDWDKTGTGTCVSSGGSGGSSGGSWGGSGGGWSGSGGSGSGTTTTTTTKSACSGTWTPNHNTWNGCITDRGPSPPTNPPTSSATAYDENVAPPVAGTQNSLYPADQNNTNGNSCPLHMMGLSYDWTGMKNIVDQMVAAGSTNQPIGLVWGWLSLAGGGPLTAPAMDPNYKYQQVIILLSDGLNTKDRWYGDGSHTSTQVDSRMYDANNGGAGTCKNINDAGITIYTVQVNTDGSPTSTLLQNCASDSSKFFLLTSANEIITTFNTIGTNLSQLRVAK